MAMSVQFAGNLVADPELRYTQQGVAVANMRVATNRRHRDTAGEWQDGDPTYLAVTVWRRQAENLVESLRKGDQVLVIGDLQQRSYEVSGEKRTAYEVEATYVGAGLGFATARPTPNRVGSPPTE